MPILEAATETSLTISWNPPANDGGTPIIGYRAYMNDLTDGDWVLIYDGYQQPTVLVKTQEGLKAGEYYRFRISSINLVGEGQVSDDSTLLCAAHPGAPSQPQVVSSTAD